MFAIITNEYFLAVAFRGVVPRKKLLQLVKLNRIRSIHREPETRHRTIANILPCTDILGGILIEP